MKRKDHYHVMLSNVGCMPDSFHCVTSLTMAREIARAEADMLRECGETVKGNANLADKRGGVVYVCRDGHYVIEIAPVNETDCNGEIDY